MDSPVGKLNPLLRLAAIAGVEIAIESRISRGDDFDARDGAGATPLILAAGKRRKGAVRLLLDAGANPLLEDLSGMDALAHASKGGCAETIAILSEAVERFTMMELSPEPVVEAAEPAAEVIESVHIIDSEGAPSTYAISAQEVSSVAEEAVYAVKSDVDYLLAAQFIELSSGELDISNDLLTRSQSGEEGGAFVLDAEPLNDFFGGDWEAEVETPPPEGDESVAVAARQVHETIGYHKAVDRDEDWGDVDLYLPLRAAPLVQDEAVRDFLFVALREGMVAENRLIELCSNPDGSRNEEAEKILAFVVGELGAVIVEWTGSDETFLLEPSMEEDFLLTEAAEFAEELASGRSDPLSFYLKDIRGELLDAEEETALGYEMEAAGRAALSALAAWPEGLSAVFDAADLVERCEADAESFCAGPDPSTDEGHVASAAGATEDDDDGSALDEVAAFFVSAIAAVKACGNDVLGTVVALEEARLTRGFLMQLADRVVLGQARCEFVEALGRQAKARERMILCNLRLALSIAKKHLWSGLPLDDLVQEANIGLMKAVERYDWRKGFRFSTYATWWIRQRIRRSIDNTRRVVRIPVHAQTEAWKVLCERDSVVASLDRPETVTETARRIGMPLAKAQMLLSVFEDEVSLDEIDPDSWLTSVESLVDEMALDPTDAAESVSLRMTLLGMLEGLEARAREIILMRFGFMAEAMTLEEVGQHFGVTRERIRQIESKAMKRLSHPNRRDILEPFIGDGYELRREPSPARKNARESLSSDDEDSLAKQVHELPLPVVKHETSPFTSWESNANARHADKPTPVRGVGKCAFLDEASIATEPVFVDEQMSIVADEARSLGLVVDDRRADGGDLRIVAPYASPPSVRAFGRKLLTLGFRKIHTDVFAK